MCSYFMINYGALSCFRSREKRFSQKKTELHGQISYTNSRTAEIVLHVTGWVIKLDSEKFLFGAILLSFPSAL